MSGRAVLRAILKLAVVALLLAALAGVGLVWWAWQVLHRPVGGHGEALFLVEPGADASTILQQLEQQALVADAALARAYLVYWLDEPSLKAGEYRFDTALNTPEVLSKLVEGQVVTYPVTLVEGLTLDETADALARAGFGQREAFRRATFDTALIADLDPVADSLEGYLFPDTYDFAKGTSEQAIVAKMVATFRERFEEIRPLLDEPVDVRAVVTLASIVEKEAQLDDERALIAGVYANRLRIGMGLFADPTIIYALKLQGTWDGNLRKRDLQLDSPFNTYLHSGLPPGPIASPGLASLQAAAQPASEPYLYFVSRNDGSHVFARTKAEHDRNVERWQRRYWRERWSRESSAAASSPDSPQ